MKVCLHPLQSVSLQPDLCVIGLGSVAAQVKDLKEVRQEKASVLKI